MRLDDLPRKSHQGHAHRPLAARLVLLPGLVVAAVDRTRSTLKPAIVR